MITYKIGDALDFSDVKQNTIIAHVCNDIGGWGRGFVVSVSQKCPVVEHAYRAWSKRLKISQTQLDLFDDQLRALCDTSLEIHPRIAIAQQDAIRSQMQELIQEAQDSLLFELGSTQFVQTHSDIWFANMIAQHDVRTINGVPPIRYDALSKCLADVNKFAIANNAVIRMPRIGCGLAGGSWSVVERLINDNVAVDVVVYDFNTGDSRTIKWNA